MALQAPKNIKRLQSYHGAKPSLQSFCLDALLGPEPGSRISETIDNKPKQCLLRFRGVETEAKTSPEAASWGPFGSDLGVILGPKIGLERGTKTIAIFCTGFQAAQGGDGGLRRRLRPATAGPPGRGRGGVVTLRNRHVFNGLAP